MRSGRGDIEAASLAVFFWTLSAIALVVLIGPSLVVLLMSLTDSASLRFPPSGLSLRWYVALLGADQMQRAALNSVIVAVAATAISALLGVPAAIAIARSDRPWLRALDLMFTSPLVLPALAFGFASLIFVYQLGLRPSLPVLVLGHGVVCVPLLLRTTLASLSQLDPGLLDASETLGAGGFMTFRRVTLPLIARGVGAGAFLCFMASFDNVPVSLFLADERTEMLPIHLWQQIEDNLDVRTAASSGLNRAGDDGADGGDGARHRPHPADARPGLRRSA